MEMEENAQFIIILGRTFLATAGAMIDVKNRKLSFKLEKKNLSLISFKRCPPSYLTRLATGAYL